MITVGRIDRLHLEIKESDVHSNWMKVALMSPGPDPCLKAFVWLISSIDGFEFSRCEIYSDLNKPAPRLVYQILNDDRYERIIAEHG